MGGEDFGEFRRADPKRISKANDLLGRWPVKDRVRCGSARRRPSRCPRFTAPIWAPEADKVIATAASEALTLSRDPVDAAKP